MVGVVEGVHKIAVERVDIGELWETIENGSELFGEGLGCVFDFSGVELIVTLVLTLLFLSCAHCTDISDSADLETASNLRRESSLSSAKHNVEKLGTIWHGGDIFPGGLHGGRVIVIILVLNFTLASPRRKDIFDKKSGEGRKGLMLWITLQPLQKIAYFTLVSLAVDKQILLTRK